MDKKCNYSNIRKECANKDENGKCTVRVCPLEFKEKRKEKAV